jgi:hypothetical protein
MTIKSEQNMIRSRGVYITPTLYETCKLAARHQDIPVETLIHAILSEWIIKEYPKAVDVLEAARFAREKVIENYIREMDNNEENRPA